LPVTRFDVDADLALRAGAMVLMTRPFGLSLGDRLCLALATHEKVPVLTADTAWSAVAPLVDTNVRLVH
jgi:ribonuclease VapC